MYLFSLLRDLGQRFLSCSFHQDYPDTLVKLQKKHWDPILDWARDTFEIQIHTSDSIFSTPQPAETFAKLDRVISELDPWQMAGMFAPPLSLTPTDHQKALERATYSSKSFLIGLALVLEKVTVEEAALASTVEVSSQIQRWGEVEDCESEYIVSTIAYFCLQPTTWTTKMSVDS